VSYRRAEWFIEKPETINLGMCIAEAVKNCTTAASRTIKRGDDQEIRLAAILTDKGGGHYLHLIVDTPGESASVVPKAAPAVIAFSVGVTAPPAGQDFMDGDAFVYVLKNNVCLCTTGITDAAVRYFLANFFEVAKIRKDATSFDLIKVADVSKLALIESQGVQEIELRGTLYDATARYIHRNGQPVSLIREFAKQFRSVLGVPNDVNPDAIRVSINLVADKRRTGLALGEKRLQELAISAIEHLEKDDEFVIITKEGQRISNDEIFMKSAVKIEALGKSVSRDHAWNELQIFYAELAETGALEV
jgi:hypothetical protein